MSEIAYLHLPGLFEFIELYKKFLPLYFQHKEYFYDWYKIASIYGSPIDTIWSGGRVSTQDANPNEVLDLMNQYDISARLTFSNSLLEEEHLADKKCNQLCALFQTRGNNGVIVHSDLLKYYLKQKYPNLYLVSSTTKVLTNFNDLLNELNNEEFRYVVPDFRLNKAFDKLDSLNKTQKDKLEFLCNEACPISCNQRKLCYENVSRINLDSQESDFHCVSGKGYHFFDAMNNPSFISVEDIKKIYLPKGFSNFKIEGRGLGSALVFEFLLYYMVKSEYQIKVREEIYLDNTLDLF